MMTSDSAVGKIAVREAHAFRAREPMIQIGSAKVRDEKQQESDKLS